MSTTAKPTSAAGEGKPVENPLKALIKFGQSVWLDYIRRNLLTTGELKRLIEEDGLRGMTSNPSIFEKAITGSTDYAQNPAGIAKSARIWTPRDATSNWRSRTFRTPPTSCARFTIGRRRATAT